MSKILPKNRILNNGSLSKGLIANWSFFEGSGTKLTNLISPRNAGTIVSATWGTGRRGKALSFNGTSSYVDCGNNPSLYTTSIVSFSVWFYPTVGSQNCELGGPWDTGVAADNAYTLYLGQNAANSKTAFTIEQSNNSLITINGSTNYKVGQWNHAVGIADGTVIKLYLNGITDATPVSYNGTLKTSGVANFFLGKIGSGNYFFNGKMDDVRLWSRALTANEVRTLYLDYFNPKRTFSNGITSSVVIQGYGYTTN